MPILNGFELCKKAREFNKNIHILFITASEAYYGKFRSQHFPELGKMNYIQKPNWKARVRTNSKYDSSKFDHS